MEEPILAQSGRRGENRVVGNVSSVDKDSVDSDELSYTKSKDWGKPVDPSNIFNSSRHHHPHSLSLAYSLVSLNLLEEAEIYLVQLYTEPIISIKIT